VALQRFSPAVREWFASAFPSATEVQAKGWPAIADGRHALLLAPTGSGKTLAAFLWMIDRIGAEDPPARPDRCRVLYVSPLRALAVDVEKNLRDPISGIRAAAQRLGEEFTEPVVALRTGDTSSRERAALVRSPPDILVTTPESLYLMLTSRARDTLRSVRWLIVDEIHSLASTKRGSHLALSLERLEEICPHSPQRIGLSATQRPLDEIARFLGGQTATGTRPVSVVDAGMVKSLDLQVIVPVDDMSEPGATTPARPHLPGARSVEARSSIWPHVHPHILDLILAHHTTIVFVNARRLAERLAARLNELAGEEMVRAHHGSLAREQRLAIEDDLKSGRLRALVTTSSLELGIDMGTVDLVVLAESPGTVARGIQRIGRSGHHVGEPSVGRLFPKFRGDLLETAAIVGRMREGLVEEMRYPRLPLDVLAQQVVAMASVDEWAVDDLLALVRRAAGFAELSRDAFTAVLDLLSGRYPSDRFSGLRPRIVWDRLNGRVRAHAGAHSVAVTSGGTIPDRGLFGVFLPDGSRVGELDEEMVYERRPGEAFVLGASTWRIEEITANRVVVTPAPGAPAMVPFWKGGLPSRPPQLRRAVGALVRELRGADTATATAHLRDHLCLDDRAAQNLLGYLEAQAASTEVVPDDRTVVIERCRDEIGDWRLCILTPFGARVHAPWALAIEERLAHSGTNVRALWSDDGIVLRLPDAVDDIPTDDLLPPPEMVEDLVVTRLPATSLFASHFRENAARALLLPRRRPGQRTPLWQQRQRAADLLEVAVQHPSFPILLETMRECLADIFDLGGLREVLSGIRSRSIRAVTVETPRASPFAQSLLLGWIAVYMYEDDAPVAERRATALALDRDLLADLLGAEDLRELLDPRSVSDLGLRLQHLTPDRKARHTDALHDLLREIGDLSDEEIAARCAGGTTGETPGADTSAWVDRLLEEHRAIRVRIADERRVAAAEDASRLRDGLGITIPPGLPAAFTEPVARPLEDLLSRYARTHAPFTTGEVADRLGISPDTARDVLARLEADGRLVHGELRPGGLEREWCDDNVLRILRRLSLASLRREVEPVDAPAFSRFLQTWHRIDAGHRGVDALVAAIEQLQGVAIPASVLEHDVLPARVDDYRPAMLDELCSRGALVWIGAGALGDADGRVRLFLRDRARLLGAPAASTASTPPAGPMHDTLRAGLAARGASFWNDLVTIAGTADGARLLDALWDLVWAGEVTNDTFSPLRGPRRAARARRSGRPRPGRLTRLGPPAGAGRWSLVAPLLGPAPTSTEAVYALALQILDRQGIVTREGVRAEGVPGGFATVYPVLRAVEEAGRARRGWFVAGLGAAQFALPGAVERLRGERSAGTKPAVALLAATDPAQPYGAALAWPDAAGRPARAAGAFVVLLDGEPAAYLERGGRSLVTFPAADRDDAWIDAVVEAQRCGRLKALQIERIDDSSARTSALAPRLRSAGFTDGYRGLTLRS